MKTGKTNITQLMAVLAQVIGGPC